MTSANFRNFHRIAVVRIVVCLCSTYFFVVCLCSERVQSIVAVVVALIFAFIVHLYSSQRIRRNSVKENKKAVNSGECPSNSNKPKMNFAPISGLLFNCRVCN